MLKPLLCLALLLASCSGGDSKAPTDGKSSAAETRTTEVVVGDPLLVYATEDPDEGRLDVYTTRIGSGRAERLVGVGGRDDFSPSISPDGRSVAYRRNPPRGDEGDIYVVPTTGGKTKNLTRSPEVADWSPAWSPDGETIAFASGRSGSLDLWSMARDGSRPRQLTDDLALEEYPTWSPDGEQIAFQSTMDGEFDVFVMSSDGGDVSNITADPASDKWASWSPSGEWIAFVSTRDGGEDVFVMRPDGSSVRNVTATPDHYEEHPTWLPTGALTYLQHGESGPISSWAIDVEGGAPVRIETEAQPVFVYDWGP